jgi:hypothetical protein
MCSFYQLVPLKKAVDGFGAKVRFDDKSTNAHGLDVISKS